MSPESFADWKRRANYAKPPVGTAFIPIARSDIEAIERLSDAAIRAGAYETALEGYALALRLRSETGLHPLRRAGDDS